MDQPSKIEQFFLYNNMVCLIKALEGKFTTVDFRDESCVTGKIINVDGFMNIEMEQCMFYNSRGSEFPFDSFYVKARNIRYVHVPKGESAIQLIEHQLNNMNPKKPQRDTKRTFKQKRAFKYHKETVMNLGNKSAN